MNDVEISVTGLIRAWTDGDVSAGDELFSRVYAELRTIARRQRRRFAAHSQDTLDTTALVHEVYLRLRGATALDVRDRAHFFAVAVRASRQIISNYARQETALKRGGSAAIESMDAVDGSAAQRYATTADIAARVSDLEFALEQLERIHPRPCRVVECRYFGGLSIEETAVTLDISEATVKRDWAVAQAWLHRALRESGESDVD